MKSLIPLLLLPLALGACTREPIRQNDLGLPSCDLQQQHELPGELGGAISDPRQAHVSLRANVLLADVSTARKARRISQEQATAFSERIAAVRSQTDDLVKQQGFLSAAERASFDREFDGIARQICQPR
ncbi:hypothetical protein QE393_003094 [Pseudomonas sp. SORGH_AS 211]|uniref:hypothetical protein n=1 Tax=Pseudomonas sp. SORGH_AS_0211 TaxID=3041796 RepID=UPI002857D149|nr:hypothetical protein [Pseudomonas sp. SORGH_AS_0211]MDR6179834.1 hypothetical protein [Pseudomonas sp. SORGH_AS_0211]